MENKSEILKIIEAGLEGNRTKLIAYANLLIGKCSDDERFQNAIIDRITGEYKKKDVFKLMSNKPDK
jgi:hypothetical protein